MLPPRAIFAALTLIRTLALTSGSLPSPSVWNSFHQPEKVHGALKETLENLQLEYLDLYLMQSVLGPVFLRARPESAADYRRACHSWPVAFAKGKTDGKQNIDWDLTNDVLPTWRAMEKLVEDGLVKHIGVSNFTIGRCKKLVEHVRCVRVSLPPARMPGLCSLACCAYSVRSSERNRLKPLRDHFTGQDQAARQPGRAQLALRAAGARQGADMFLQHTIEDGS